MEPETPGDWPVRRRMPALDALDDTTRTAVVAVAERLRALHDVFADRLLTLIRRHVPGYAVLSDDDIRDSARRFLDVLVAELSARRVPDAALRKMLGEYAVERAAQGVPLDVLAVGYQLGARELLALLDEAAAEVALPDDLLLAVHDSTWELSNEASAVFARVRHDLALEREHFDAERRSAFVAGVLSGAFTAERIKRDAHLVGLAPQYHHVALAARAASREDAAAIRRAVATAVGVPADRLLITEVGAVLGCVAPRAPESVAGHLVAVGPAAPLDRLSASFDEATLVLETATRFAMSDVVSLADLGPRPLVLAAGHTADGLAARHLAPLAAAGRSSGEISETARVYLACDQDVREVARRLAVHPNTVRYRVNRFQQLTGLDLGRTEDLVTSWWLLNRRGD
ncbi:helix-turn-helix domain-containing protein [Streptomyces sp. NPDC007084]|uniref:PucR family transcriptional regulator n=1 Tax=Streptomyces sp. NPDC007084 TaxID=3154313 RepID=UPI0034537190